MSRKQIGNPVALLLMTLVQMPSFAAPEPPINKFLTIPELFEKSDIVVIVTVVANKTTDHVLIDEWSKHEFLEVKTTFQVERVLKGSVKDKQVEIDHYKEKPDTQHIPPARLVNFQTIEQDRSDSRSEIRKSKTAKIWDGTYMLFLKRSNITLTFVTGQYEAAYSVRRLEVPEK